MQKIILAAVIGVCLFNACTSPRQTVAQVSKPEMNIKQYWLVMIKTGPNDAVIKDSAQRAGLFAGHFSNMEKLHKQGYLKVAGPFGKNNFQWRGLFILDCNSLETAQQLVATDPAIAAGIFVTDIVPWYTEPSGSFAAADSTKNKKL